MDLFAPESRESFEKYKESQKFSEKIEKDLLRSLAEDKEVISDIISCPISSCRNPLKVQIRKNEIELLCSNCGWQKIIKKANP